MTPGLGRVRMHWSLCLLHPDVRCSAAAAASHPAVVVDFGEMAARKGWAAALGPARLLLCWVARLGRAEPRLAKTQLSLRLDRGYSCPQEANQLLIGPNADWVPVNVALARGVTFGRVKPLIHLLVRVRKLGSCI